MAIELKNVTKRFGALAALDDVSISFGDNKIFGLLGNNGAGKTTLMNVITNRLYPSSGEVLVDGESVLDNDRALGKLFMMGEQNMYPDGMKVKKGFEVTGAFYPGFDMEKAMELSKRFGLDQNKKIASLSTGYASIYRLILAMAVNTPYLLLDEPVLGLDAQHRDMFYRVLMEKYSENPCTIIVSTHLIQEIENLIEHAMIIKDGRVIKDAPMEGFLTGAYNVSGPASLVDEYAGRHKILSQHTIGGLKTACLQGESGDIPVGLELSKINLQEYFVSLMGFEEEIK